MSAARHPLKLHVIWLVKRGEISSLAEAAMIADASPQSVLNWLNEAGIEMRVMRLARIARLRTQAQMKAESKGQRRPTQQEIRRETLKSVRRFNAANAAKTIQP